MKINANKSKRSNNLISSGIFFLHLLALCVWSGEPLKTTISVYGLESIEISQTLALSLQEQIESNLIHYGSFEVVSRKDMDKIFAETKLQQQGVCSDSACLIRAGNILGVEKLITGTISRVGQTYNIVLKLIDIQNGRIESSVNRQCRGTIDSLLPLTDAALKTLMKQAIEPVIVKKDTVITVTDTIVNTVVDTVIDTIEITTFTRKEAALYPQTRITSKSTENEQPSIDPKKLGIGAASILAGIALAIVINSAL